MPNSTTTSGWYTVSASPPTPRRFADVPMNRGFRCDMGGDWVKESETAARCLRGVGQQFTEGYIATFSPDDPVNTGAARATTDVPGRSLALSQNYRISDDTLVCPECDSSDIDVEVAAVASFSDGGMDEINHDYSIETIHGTRWCRECGHEWSSRPTA